MLCFIRNISSKNSNENLNFLGVYRRIGCTVAYSWGTWLFFAVSSLWVFNNSNSNCASNCANNCGNNFRNNIALRRGLFGSVAPLKGDNFVIKLLNQGTKFG